MQFRYVSRRISGEGKRWLGPAVLGVGIWLATPTILAYQDMVSFVAGIESGAARWGTFVAESAAGSLHEAELPFLDPTMTGAIAGSGLTAPGIGTVVLSAKVGKRNEVPDEVRINRAGKEGRVLTVAPVSPPKYFNAGSIVEQTSMFEPVVAPAQAMAFAKPAIEGKEIEIATVFHPYRDEAADGSMPAMFASLISNEKADVLATAYAPPEPDYAVSSPFASLLKEEDEDAGRFIPPLAPGDHAWMSKPLPPAVFSDKEQKCLAQGVYFEARGENLKGQAAVAQVILNRVRNPAYPNTICGVVYQNDNWRNRCQFSFACDGVRDRIRSPRHYEIAKEIAIAVTAGKIFLPEVASATHYHATYVSPRWARSMDRVKKIGLHIFYRTKGGGWS